MTTTPAIPPPASTPRASVTSDPPAVKAARIQWDALENITAIIGASVLLYYGKISQEVWGPVVAAASFGAGALRQFGAKRAGIASVMLLGAHKLAGAGLVAGARYLLVAVVVAYCFIVHGCAGYDLPSAATARLAANKSGEALNRMGAALSGVCAGEAPPKACPAAIEAFNDAAAAHRLTQDFIDTYAAVTQ